MERVFGKSQLRRVVQINRAFNNKEEIKKADCSIYYVMKNMFFALW